MSAPDAKAWVPAPRNTIARTASLASSVVTRASSAHMARLIALRTSGRLKTTVARAPARCTRMSGWVMEAECSKEVVDRLGARSGHPRASLQHQQRREDLDDHQHVDDVTGQAPRDELPAEIEHAESQERDCASGQ